MADLERGQRIKTRREELHLTQPAVVDLMEARARELPETHDLHGKAPITLRGYQTYERGGGIVWEKAKLLAGILQMDVQAMMHGEPEQDQETPDPFAGAPAVDQLAAVTEHLARVDERLARIEGLLERVFEHRSEQGNDIIASLREIEAAVTGRVDAVDEHLSRLGRAVVEGLPLEEQPGHQRVPAPREAAQN